MKPAKSFFRPNIDNRGRLIRGTLALTLLVGGILTWNISRIPAGFLLLSAAFVGYEAMRSWCFLRACGIRTRF